jgi:hypothetical protein
MTLSVKPSSFVSKHVFAQKRIQFRNKNLENIGAVIVSWVNRKDIQIAPHALCELPIRPSNCALVSAFHYTIGKL